jgi:undecaprenyl-diphosphatase
MSSVQRAQTNNIRLLVAGLLSLVSFVIIAALVFSGVIQTQDTSLAIAINKFYLGASLTQLMVLATDYGREYFWIPVVALMLLFGKRRTKVLALELALLFIVGIVVGEALKVIVFRERPFEALSNSIILRVATDPDSSFPSGHVVIVSIGAVFAIISFRRKAFAGLLALEAAVVCYSRVYVGAHYPTDVLAGIMIGAAISFLGYYFLERYLKLRLERIIGFIERVVKTGFFDL